MNEFWNWLKKVLSRLMESLSSSSNSTTPSSQTTQNQSENSSTGNQANSQKSNLEIAVDNAKKELTEIALETVTEKGLSLLGDYTNMISKLSPLQKEYVMNIAILKTQNIEEMTAEEIIELGEISVRTSELGLEVSEELNKFWSKFGDVVREIASQVKGVATKVIATSLVGVLL